MKISCPQCGAEFELENPEPYIICDYCKNSLFIDLDEIITVYTYKSAIEPHLIGSYLKKDFEKMGFDEEIRVVNSVPVYIPFWKLEGMEKLKRSCSRFPAEEVNILSTKKVFFDASRIDFRIEVMEIDTQPRSIEKRILYYYPFFRMDIIFREKKYKFFVNAVTGDVYGESIPYISGNDVNRLFPLFLIIFAVFLAVNYFFDHFFVSISLNIIFIFIFFQISLQVIEKRIYNR
jgi:hypothetical protein